MNKSNEILRTFFIALSVTLIMQLGEFADFKKWLIIILITLAVTILSMAFTYYAGISEFSNTEEK